MWPGQRIRRTGASRTTACSIPQFLMIVLAPGKNLETRIARAPARPKPHVRDQGGSSGRGGRQLKIARQQNLHLAADNVRHLLIQRVQYGAFATHPHCKEYSRSRK